MIDSLLRNTPRSTPQLKHDGLIVANRRLRSELGSDGGLFRLPLVQHAWSIPRSLFLPSALRVWTTPRLLVLGGTVHYLVKLLLTGDSTQVTEGAL